MTITKRLFFFYAVWVVLAICFGNTTVFAEPLTRVSSTASTAAKKTADSRLPVHVVYFVPTDCQPISGYEKRLDLLMSAVQLFYRNEMQRNGYGPMTFKLDRDEKKQLKVYLVQAENDSSYYGRESGGNVFKESEKGLEAQGIETKDRVIVSFTPLLFWEGDRAKEHGPYVGGGNHLGGRCCVFDDMRLDPRLLGSKAPGGFYGGPCSIGEFNSHYIGGLAHEMGHAFGLPHVRESDDAQKRFGRALMGSGNHTFGDNLRREGNGTFLHGNSAMLLSQCRAFAGDLPHAKKNAQCEILEFETSLKDNVLLVRGKIRTTPPVIGILAYSDNRVTKSSYDAIGWNCKVKPDAKDPSRGTFFLKIGEFNPEEREIRLLACHQGGKQSKLESNQRDFPGENN